MTSENIDLTFGSAPLDRLQEIRAMEDFPVPKGPAMALIRLTQRESTSLGVLAHALKADPVFSVRLIKVANGANGTEKPPVVSLRDAVSVLGVPAVRGLAMGFSLLSNHRSGKCAADRSVARAGSRHSTALRRDPKSEARKRSASGCWPAPANWPWPSCFRSSMQKSWSVAARSRRTAWSISSSRPSA
jgi:hypothetical protein